MSDTTTARPRLTRLLLTAAVMGSAVVGVTSVPALAADGCGDGWHQQSDGHLNASTSYSLAGGRSFTAYHGGWVRFCTKEKTLQADDLNRKVLLGTPGALESSVFAGGAHQDGTFCAKETIKVYLNNVESGSTVGVSGASDGSFGVSVSTSYTNPVVTVYRRNWVCTNSGPINLSYAGGVVTGPNSGARVDHVEYTTSMKMTYRYNGTTYNPTRDFVENDYS